MALAGIDVALLIGAVVPALLMSSSNLLAKRLGPYGVAMTGVALVAMPSPLLAGLGVAQLGLWLYDRGIPGNRRRSAAMWALAGLTAALGVAAVITALR